MGDVGMMSGAPEGGFMGSPGPSQAFFEQHGPGWGQGRHGRGRGRGMRGGYGGPGMRGKSLRQHMLAQVDRSGFGRDDDEKRVVK